MQWSNATDWPDRPAGRPVTSGNEHPKKILIKMESRIAVVVSVPSWTGHVDLHDRELYNNQNFVANLFDPEITRLTVHETHHGDPRFHLARNIF